MRREVEEKTAMAPLPLERLTRLPREQVHATRSARLHFSLQLLLRMGCSPLSFLAKCISHAPTQRTHLSIKMSIARTARAASKGATVANSMVSRVLAKAAVK